MFLFIHEWITSHFFSRRFFLPLELREFSLPRSVLVWISEHFVILVSRSVFIFYFSFLFKKKKGDLRWIFSFCFCWIWCGTVVFWLDLWVDLIFVALVTDILLVRFHVLVIFVQIKLWCGIVNRFSSYFLRILRMAALFSDFFFFFLRWNLIMAVFFKRAM